MLRLGQGYISFFFFFSRFYWNFKIIGQAFIQSKNIFQKDTDTPHYPPPPLSLTQICMCVCVSVCVPADVHVVGGVYVHAAPSSGGTYRLCQCNSVGDIAAVCTTSSHFCPEMLFLHWQRLCIWAPSILLLFSSLLLGGFFPIFFPPCSVPLVLLDRLKLL